MSTRSAIGFPQGDTWKGRYVHSDGYPSAKIPELRVLVNRDGLESVLKIITEQWYGWSNLDPDQPDITTVKIDPNADYTTYAYGTPEYAAWQIRSKRSGHGDGRFANVPGYGTAYTTEQGQSSEDEWVTPEADWGTEYAYILSEQGIGFFINHGSEGWEFKGLFSWTGKDVPKDEE